MTCPASVGLISSLLRLGLLLIPADHLQPFPGEKERDLPCAQSQTRWFICGACEYSSPSTLLALDGFSLVNVCLHPRVLTEFMDPSGYSHMCLPWMSNKHLKLNLPNITLFTTYLSLSPQLLSSSFLLKCSSQKFYSALTLLFLSPGTSNPLASSVSSLCERIPHWSLFSVPTASS